MSDIQNSMENSDNDKKNNGGLSQGKKPGVWSDLLIGIGLPAIAYLVIWAASFTKTVYSGGIAAFCDLVIIAVLSFLVVKLLRTDHKLAAVLILVLASPLVLGLLLFGACALLYPSLL